MSRLALIELVERDGRIGRCIDVQAWPLSLGRALDNDVVLDDPSAAAHHAQLQLLDDGQVQLQVLDTVNGVMHGRRRLAAGESLVLPAGGAALQIGSTRLRVRLLGEVLAPERPLPPGGRRLRPALMLGAITALVLADQWVHLDPGADYSAWLPVLLGLPVLALGWCGGWALLSKLFQHRFDFAGHLLIALPWALAITLVDDFLPQLAAMLGQPWLWHASGPLQGLLMALLLYRHLVHVLPLHRRAVGLTVGVLVLAGGALSAALTWRSNDSLRSAPYMSTLPMPALRWAGTVPPQQLVQEMGPLADKLLQRAKKARQDDAADEGGDIAE
jgi:hypothetical protein